MTQTDESYYYALKRLSKGAISSPRGMQVKEIFNYTLDIDPIYPLVTLEKFETNESYAMIEWAWYLSGDNCIDYHPKIQKTWKAYSDDGIHVNSNYGHRFLGKHKDFRNQVLWLIKLLKADPDSRRGVININADIDKDSVKDMPCTMYLQFFIRQGKLNMIVSMRSQDIYYGTRNDIYCFSQLQKLIAENLNCDLGWYKHHCSNLHIYEKHWDRLNYILKNINI